MISQQIIKEIEERVGAIYQLYSIGEDVPPATLFRTEGFIEAACLMGVVKEDEVLDLMAELHLSYFNSPLKFERGGRVRIQSSMQRAPVYPST